MFGLYGLSVYFEEGFKVNTLNYNEIKGEVYSMETFTLGNVDALKFIFDETKIRSPKNTYH